MNNISSFQILRESRLNEKIERDKGAYDELKRIKLKGVSKMDVKIESAWF